MRDFKTEAIALLNESNSFFKNPAQASAPPRPEGVSQAQVYALLRIGDLLEKILENQQS